LGGNLHAKGEKKKREESGHGSAEREEPWGGRACRGVSRWGGLSVSRWCGRWSIRKVDRSRHRTLPDVEAASRWLLVVVFVFVFCLFLSFWFGGA
jgi:hypothetical protein